MSLLKDLINLAAITVVVVIAFIIFVAISVMIDNHFIEKKIIIDGNFLIYKGDLYEKYLPEHAQIGEKDAD